MNRSRMMRAFSASRPGLITSVTMIWSLRSAIETLLSSSGGLAARSCCLPLRSRARRLAEAAVEYPLNQPVRTGLVEGEAPGTEEAGSVSFRRPGGDLDVLEGE